VVDPRAVARLEQGVYHRRLGQRPDSGGGRGFRPLGVTGHGPSPLARDGQLGTGAATGPGAGTRGANQIGQAGTPVSHVGVPVGGERVAASSTNPAMALSATVE
jgi:hypothetical protein